MHTQKKIRLHEDYDKIPGKSSARFLLALIMSTDLLHEKEHFHNNDRSLLPRTEIPVLPVGGQAAKGLPGHEESHQRSHQRIEEVIRAKKEKEKLNEKEYIHRENLTK